MCTEFASEVIVPALGSVPGVDPVLAMYTEAEELEAPEMFVIVLVIALVAVTNGTLASICCFGYSGT